MTLDVVNFEVSSVDLDGARLDRSAIYPLGWSVLADSFIQTHKDRLCPVFSVSIINLMNASSIPLLSPIIQSQFLGSRTYLSHSPGGSRRFVSLSMRRSHGTRDVLLNYPYFLLRVLIGN
jgi:hypothetical protein